MNGWPPCLLFAKPYFLITVTDEYFWGTGRPTDDLAVSASETYIVPTCHHHLVPLIKILFLHGITDQIKHRSPQSQIVTLVYTYSQKQTLGGCRPVKENSQQWHDNQCWRLHEGGGGSVTHWCWLWPYCSKWMQIHTKNSRWYPGSMNLHDHRQSVPWNHSRQHNCWPQNAGLSTSQFCFLLCFWGFSANSTHYTMEDNIYY